MQESEEAKERKKYLLDPKYLVAPDDKDRIKIDIAEDEVIPDRYVKTKSSSFRETMNILDSCFE